MNFTQQHISLTFVVLLNAVTLFLVVSEYLRAPRSFLHATALAQAGALVWHLATVWLMLVGPALPALLVSAAATWLFSLAFLAAVLAVRHGAVPPAFATVALAVTGLLVIASLVGPLPLHLLLWGGAGIVLLGTPLLTLTTPLPRLRIPLVVIQLSIGSLFCTGIVLVVIGRPELGGTLYLVNALLVPSAVQVFFQHALRLDTDERRASEARYRALFESLRDAYYWLDAGRRIQTASPSISQFGHTPASVRGVPLDALFDDPAAMAGHLDRAATDGGTDVQARLRCADGTLRDCDVSIQAVHDGVDLHFTGMIQDVTDRNLLERQFLDAQRRESLGVLAGGVAHDFNNLLQGITSHAELLQQDGLSRQHRTASVQAILDGAATASTQCSRLLQYTGKATFTARPLAVAPMLEELAGVLRAGTCDLGIEVRLEDADLVVEGDETLLRQVVLNLLQNAIDASAPGDVVNLSLATCTAATAVPAGAKVFGAPPSGRNGDGDGDGDCVCIDVSDAGNGMDMETLQKVFDPFFTTKAQGHGLGLAAVLGIVHRHDGVVAVRSAPGKGSCFRLVLPRSTRAAPQPAATSGTTEASAGQTVLVVDDSSSIRDIASTLLGLHGYTVLQAADGADALQAFQARPEGIDVVLSDINMPALDGFGLLRGIRETSEVPVVLMSGLYNDLEDREDFGDNVAFLPKPFRQQQLLEQLAMSLQGR